MRLRILAITLLAVGAIGIQASFAQGVSPTKSTFELKKSTDTLFSLNRQLELARQLIQQRNYGSAADMLEILYEKSPQDQSVIGMLRYCYTQLKQYAKAELFVRKQIAQDPRNFGTWLDLAEVQADEGFSDSSRVSYHEARKLIPPGDTTRFQILLRSQISRNMNDDALGLIDTLRHQFRDSGLYALEKGLLLEHAKDYRGAIREYGPILTNDTTNEALEVERRLMSLLDFVDSSPEVEKGLQDEATRTHSSVIIRLLADHYIKINQFDKAFAYAVKRDSLYGFQGVSLVSFMRQCYDRRLYQQTVRMGEYVFAKFPSGSAFIDASMVYADALAHLGRTNDALARYSQVVAVSPRPEDKGEALLDMGLIYFDDLGDYKQALVYFDSVATKYQVGQAYVDACRMRPYCHLRMGDRAAARADFQRLKKQLVIQDITEEVSYELAVLDFYDKRYDSANVGFRKLIVDYPRGLYVNDALQILMVMDEAKGAPELLGEFGDALWFQECAQDDSSRARLDRLTREENSALADDALYRLVMLDLKLNDSTSASAAIERLTDSFPASYYVPFGLKEKADMLSVNATSLDEAKELYKRILERYPNYPFVAEIRKRLRQLEIDHKLG
jgi:tetratricopeptide (TPR) repeat protein